MKVFEKSIKGYTAVFNCFYIIIAMLYAAALIVIVMGEELMSDYDTALYWFNELINTVVSVQNIVLCGFAAILLMFRNDDKPT